MPDNEATVNINVNGAREIEKMNGTLESATSLITDEISKVREPLEELADSQQSFIASGGDIDDGITSGTESSLLDGTDADGVSAPLFNEIQHRSDEIFDKIDESVDEIVEKTDKAADNIKGAGDSARAATDAVVEATDALDGSDGNRHPLNDALRDAAENVENLSAASSDAAETMQDAAKDAADGIRLGAEGSTDGASSALDRLSDGADTVSDVLSGTRGNRNPLSRVLDNLKGKMGGLGEAIGAEGAGGVIGSLGKFAGVAGAVVSALAIAGGAASEAIDMYQTARATSITQTGGDGDLLLGAREFADVQFRSMTSGLSEDEAKTIQAGLIEARLPFGSEGRRSYQEGMEFSQNAVLNYGLEASQAVDMYTKAAVKNGRTIDEINAHLQSLLDVSKATGITVGELYDNYQKNEQKLEGKYGDAGQDYQQQVDALFGGTDEELRAKYGDDERGLNQILNAKSFVSSQMSGVNMRPGSWGQQLTSEYIEQGYDEGQAAAKAAFEMFLKTGNGSQDAILFMQKPLTGNSMSVQQYIANNDFDGLEKVLQDVKGGDDSGGWNWPSIASVMTSIGMSVDGISDPHNVRVYLENISGAVGPNSKGPTTNLEIQQENQAQKAELAPSVDPYYDPSQDYLGLNYFAAHNQENFATTNATENKVYVDVGGSKMDVTPGSKGAELVQQYKEDGFNDEEAAARASMNMKLQGVEGLSLPLVTAKPGEKSVRQYIMEGDYDGLEKSLSDIQNGDAAAYANVAASMSALGVPTDVLSSPTEIRKYVESVGAHVDRVSSESGKSSPITPNVPGIKVGSDGQQSGQTASPFLNAKSDGLDINISLSLEGDMGEIVTQKSIEHQYRQGLNNGND